MTVTNVFFWIYFLFFQSLQNNSLRMQKVGTFSCWELYVVSFSAPEQQVNSQQRLSALHISMCCVTLW